jgi:cation transport ATPase
MESFVQVFAKWYTPLVVVAFLCLVLIPLAAHAPNYKVRSLRTRGDDIK